MTGYAPAEFTGLALPEAPPLTCGDSAGLGVAYVCVSGVLRDPAQPCPDEGCDDACCRGSTVERSGMGSRS